MRVRSGLLSVILIFATLMALTAPYAPAETKTAAASGDINWTEVEKKIFRLIYTDLRSVDLSEYKIAVNSDDYKKLHYCVYYTPTHLWPDIKIIRSPKTGLVLRAESGGDAVEMKKKYSACVRAINAATADIKNDSSLSDADKLLLLHDRLAVLSGYDSAASADRRNAARESFSAYGPLVLHKGVCNGYTLAYGWMLDVLGVRNRYTESAELGHSWNMVWLDGKPYYVDVTYDDPYPDTPGRVLHKNFLISYKTFSTNHGGASDFPETPVSTLYENGYFVRSTREIIYFKGELYYLDDSVKSLVRRSASGRENVVKDLSSDSGYGKIVLTASDIENNVYCPHDGAVLQTLHGGADCKTRGDAVYKCPVCALEYSVPGAGAFGPHDFSARIVSGKTLKSAAACVLPAEYYYSCSVCGEIEKNDGHTFTDGEAAGHKWGLVVEQPPTCSSYGVWYDGCVVCHEEYRSQNRLAD